MFCMVVNPQLSVQKLKDFFFEIWTPTNTIGSNGSLVYSYKKYLCTDIGLLLR